jgi:hypothetical protein
MTGLGIAFKIKIITEIFYSIFLMQKGIHPFKIKMGKSRC